MNLRTPVVAFGAGVTAFLVVTVLVIEALDFEFSALIGLPVGVLVGAVAFAAVLVKYDDVGDPLRWTLAGVAGFGYAVFAVLAADYVHLVELGVTPTVGVAFVVGGLVAVAAAVLDSGERPEGSRGAAE